MIDRIFTFGPLAIALGLSVWVTILREEIKVLEAQAQTRDATHIAGAMTAQVEELKAGDIARGAQLDFQQSMTDTGGGIVADVFAQSAAAAAPLHGGIIHASDDAPAAPVLCDTVERLRAYAQTLALVRAGDNQAAGVLADADSAGVAATLWPRLSCPFSQAAFADMTRRLADSYGEMVLKQRGVGAYQAEFNSKILVLNGEAQ